MRAGRPGARRRRPFATAVGGSAGIARVLSRASPQATRSWPNLTARSSARPSPRTTAPLAGSGSCSLRLHGAAVASARDLTAATLRCFEELGCRSVVLAATDLGQPVYERLGFVPMATTSSSRLAARRSGARSSSARLTPADLPAVAALDRRPQAEDRSHLIAGSARGLGAGRRRAIRGFALRTLWGFGPVIAPDPTDGARPPGSPAHPRLGAWDADHRRRRRTAAAVAHLQSVGFQQERRLPRMVLGEP